MGLKDKRCFFQLLSNDNNSWVKNLKTREFRIKYDIPECPIILIGKKVNTNFLSQTSQSVEIGGHERNKIK